MCVCVCVCVLQYAGPGKQQIGLQLLFHLVCYVILCVRVCVRNRTQGGSHTRSHWDREQREVTPQVTSSEASRSGNPAFWRVLLREQHGSPD